MLPRARGSVSWQRALRTTPSSVDAEEGTRWRSCFERVAGLNIGKAALTVCLSTPGPRGRPSETRTFPTTTRALEVMRDWLLDRGVTVTAMELTSTYWKPAFYCLEEVLEVWLLDAAHARPARRGDGETGEDARPGVTQSRE